MSQVNINSSPPPPAVPPRRPSLWLPIAAFLALLAILAIVLGVRHATAPGTAAPSATPTPPSVTATAVGLIVATATPAAGQVPTDTPAPSGTATPAPPANPTALHVTSGSCMDQAIQWSWPSGARATSYELVLYDPRTGATIKDVTTSGTTYRLAAGPGAAVALKIRSRNSAGTGQGYFTPGSVGSVPPPTTNPTLMTSKVTDHRITWSWAGSRHATAYDLVLFHYSGSTPHTDITGRTNQGQWSVTVTPGITYYLKVRSVGACGPPNYFAASNGTIVGATPTPGG